MRAVIVGAGMGGLMTALALRQSGIFSSVDIYEQTKEPSTAGAGLNIPPNGARLCRWLGVDLDGGDPKGPDGAIDGGRAAIGAQAGDGLCKVLPSCSLYWAPGRAWSTIFNVGPPCPISSMHLTQDCGR